MLSHTERLCSRCHRIYDIGEFQWIDERGVVHSTLTCHICKREAGELADKKAIAKASRELVSALEKSRSTDSADLPAIIDAFKRKIGGNEALAELLTQDIRRLHGYDLPEEAKADHVWHEQVIQKYHQMVLKIISDKDDKASSYDLSTLSEEDLHSILVPLAKDLLVNDKVFREEVLTLVSSDLQKRQVIDQDLLESDLDDVEGSSRSPTGELVESG